MKYMILMLVLLFSMVVFAQKEKSTTQKAVAAAPGMKKNTNLPVKMNSGGAYKVRLTELRDKVNALKSAVFDAKTRLLLLREQILHNLVSEAKLQIIHVNDISSFMDLKSVAYYLDDNKIYGSDNRNNSLNKRDTFSVYSGSVSPTHHILAVKMVYQGGGGFFSYTKNYRFRIRGSLPFFAARGQKIVIRVIGYRKGGLSRMEDSPTMRFELKRINLTEKVLKAAKQSGEK